MNRMKIKSITAVVFIITFWAFTQPSLAQKGKYFILDGKIANINNGIIRLSYYDQGKQKYDSAFIKSEKYLFHGYISMPCKAVLSYQSSSQKQHLLNFWLDYDKLQIITDSIFQRRNIVGGAINREDSILDHSKQSINEKYKSLLDTLENLRDRDSISVFREKIYPYLDEIKSIDFNFFASHPNSTITGFYLMPYLAEISLDTLQKIYSRFNRIMRSSIYGKEIKKRIENLERVSTSQVANAFCGANFFGNTRICLKNLNGKYVVLEFWGSWCRPCRKEHDKMIELYNRVKNSLVEFIGIANETDVEEWKKAITMDKVTWPQILSREDTLRTSTDIADLYAVRAYPTLFLIDKNGIIIGRYGAFLELESKLLTLILGIE